MRATIVMVILIVTAIGVGYNTMLQPANAPTEITAKTATESVIKTNAYSLNLPSYMKWENYNNDGYDNTRFYLNNVEVGGVVRYSYNNSNALKEQLKEDFLGAYTKFFDEIDAEKFKKNPQIDRMGGGSQYGDFELWFGTSVQYDMPVDETHYFYVTSDNSVYDLWFDRIVFSETEEENTLKSFSLNETIDNK